METAAAILTFASLAGWIFLKHSFFAAPFVVFLSIWVQDFFPLSHFPMYGDPDNSENYLYVASMDAGGKEIEPLPVRRITSVTAPKVKKMYKSWARDYAAVKGKKDTQLTMEERAAVGRDLLAFLREQAERRGRELPGDLGLVEVWIVHENDSGLTETSETVAILPAKS